MGYMEQARKLEKELQLMVNCDIKEFQAANWIFNSCFQAAVEISRILHIYE